MNIDGMSVQPAARTGYAFPAGHIFAILAPEPELYEFVSRTRDLVIIRAQKPPCLEQSLTRREFDDLVERQKVDPRYDDNDRCRREMRTRNHGAACLDIPQEEREALDFFWKLCRRIHDMNVAGEISLADKALRPVIMRLAFDLSYGRSAASGETPQARIGRRRGSKKEDFPASSSERRIRARKEKVIFGCPSPSTVRDYIRRLVDADWDIRALRDRRKGRCGNRASRLPTAMSYRIMQPWVLAYLDRSRPTVALLYKLMIGSARAEDIDAGREAENLRPHPGQDLETFASVNAERAAVGHPPLCIPSRSTFERAIRKLDKYQVKFAREGAKAARAHFRIGGRREGPLTAGERVAIDNWRAQLMTLKLPSEFWAGLDADAVDKLLKLRLNVCIAICEATKIVLGLRLSLNPDENTSIETLHMVCRDKTDIALTAGCTDTWNQAITPVVVRSDSGSEFIGYRFRAAVQDIGADNDIGQAGRPDARACIERFNGTLDRQLMQFFQERTFSGVEAKGDYNPAAMANVTADVLGKALVRWVVDSYHNLPHAGLGGETPNDAWERLSQDYGVRPPPSPAQMRAVFGFSDERRIQNRGIRFMGLFYRNSPDNMLAKLRNRIGQKEVRIRADLRNLGQISVCENVRGARWFTVKCDFDWTEGMSADEWIRTTTNIRQRHADLAKLRETTVLSALQDIRRMSAASAEAAGIGPSTMTREMLLACEEREFRDLNILVPDRRGAAFAGITDGSAGASGSAGTETGPDGSSSADDIPAEETEASVSRRRRGLGSSFLKEDE